jgi:hypothetical protein
MKDDQMVDYSPHILNITKHVRLANDLLLAQRYDDAIEALVDISVEARLAYSAVRHLKEKQNVHQQTKTV